MTVGPNLLVCRLSIFSAMVAATVTLIYLAPVPDQSYKNCDRPCHDLDWPMICRFKLIIEKLPTPVICRDCHNCSFCSSSSNAPRELVALNRQFPGPSMHVCHNDVVIVDVVNKLQGQSVTFHWRGQTNVETPFMDGVPSVTQCPIGPYTTFQYKFRASSSGTHSYHAFSDSDRSSGAFGALIVRKPEKLDEYRQIFDVDNEEHVLVLSESDDSVLINGAGPKDKPLNLRVKNGSSNRFRVIYASGSGCPMTLSIKNHPLNVIYVEGNPIKSSKVSSIQLIKGETIDFVLMANKSPGSYKLEVRSNCNAKSLIGKAILTYEGISQEVNADEEEASSKSGEEDCDAGNGKTCLQEFQNTEEMDKDLLTVHRRIYLGFDSVGVKAAKGNADARLRQFRTNNISFLFPPSPILTQPTDVPVDLMCNESHLPDRCKDEESCDCVHLEHIPLDSSTEIVLVDQGGEEEDGYIFHLHGYKFYQVGTKILDQPMSKSEVEALDSNFDFIKRNLKNPLIKSTVRVPKNGVVAIRFMAKNPGFWLLRDENAQGWTRGMDILFQVGDTGDIVATPSNFPVCGNFVGPDFFLL
ncbi:unnamed protein product [Phyllotreta striolata]|uniref:Uncharacterized protein n=1 Tax=Phyllotreta striolata TaxID=444603 RepID=A0A9N9XN19_PHYSR|nr:unnamed protein product [Phyllotreta striolata]